MRSEDRIRYLSSLDLFRHFSEAELYEFLAENVEELRVAAGEVLCREGSPGDDMYVLLAGELKITKGGKFITTKLESQPGHPSFFTHKRSHVMHLHIA